MKKCKYCKSEIDKKAKVCPNCTKKQGIPKWIVIIGIICIIAILANAGNSEPNSNDKFEKNKKNTVTVIDFSAMTEAEIDKWCNDNKVNCAVSNEYSDTVEKGNFISQSVENNKTIYEGDKISIKISLGKEPTNGQKNALKKAESYSKTMHMSKQGIYNQLTSTIEGFSKEEAQYAIDNIQANWNQNALEKAKSYQSTMSMSKSAIYRQLTSTIEGFTNDEAQYAIDHLDD